MKRYTIIFLTCLAITSGNAQPEKVLQYVDTYKGLAIEEMIRTGVPAAITLAQGILESQSGESELAKGSNNHFGIKCKTEWTGPKTYHDDDEKGECFRVYPDAAASYRDHSDFLRSRPNYAPLFHLDPADYTAWAEGLKKAGYATSPAYPQRLIKLIQDYHLQQYSLEAIAQMHQQPPTPGTANKDTTAIATLVHPAGTSSSPQPGLAETPNEPADSIPGEAATPGNPSPDDSARHPSAKYPDGVFTINHARVLYAKAGTALLSLASQYDIPLNKLFAYNEMPPVDILPNDRLLYLEKKDKKGADETHTVRAGETLYQIAQDEGIRLESLLAYNHCSENTPLKPGVSIRLRPETKNKPAARKR
ncbi:MAG TPA: glucosaminidase domain-containing protein [Sediminibacterium sp.]|nr:glucosaminidase domain-containing protein [Sediminibacterium sp.]